MLEIRRATPHDAMAMLRVRREAILSKAASHYDQAILNAWVGAESSDRIAGIEQQISDTRVITLVAVAEELIGFAMAIPSEHQLRSLYTKPNRVDAVGRQLLSAMETFAFETTAFLLCDASLNAENFYAVNGYRAECHKDHVSEPDGIVSRVVQMRKPRPNG